MSENPGLAWGFPVPSMETAFSFLLFVIFLGGNNFYVMPQYLFASGTLNSPYFIRPVARESTPESIFLLGISPYTSLKVTFSHVDTFSSFLLSLDGRLCYGVPQR